MWNLFSTYELKARLLPAVLVMIPAFAWLHTAGFAKDLSILEGTLGVAALYLLAQIFAKLGRDLQPRLFTAWGGAPSTKLLRYANSTFSEDQKNKISQAVQSMFGQALPTADEEAANPEDADRHRDMIFNEVRSYLYEEESKGLWRSQLAEYGLMRNLLGSAWVTGAIAVGYGVFCLHRTYRAHDPLTAAIGAMSLTYGLIFMVGRYSFLLSFTEHLADRYAQSAWLAFLNSARSKPEGAKWY